MKLCSMSMKLFVRTDGLRYDKTTIITSLPRSACTDTSIASSCWAYMGRGCHRAVPHSFLNGFEPYSIPLTQKRLLPCRKWQTLSSPSVQNVEQERRNFVLPRNPYDEFELNGHIKCLNVRYDTCEVVTNSYVN